MDRLRAVLLFLIVVGISNISAASPLDSVYDLLYAVQLGNVDMAVDLLSESLSAQLESRCEAIRRLAEEDPDLACRLLAAASLRIDPEIVVQMDLPQLLGILFQRIPEVSEEMVEVEYVNMSGRTASVTLVLMAGDSLGFDLVWERGGWRITGSTLLSRLFEGP